MRTLFHYSKQEVAWALFDWANSAFATTVMAGLFPIFFKTYYASQFSSQDSTSLLGLCLSITGLIVAILNPFLGFLTDRLQSRKLATLGSATVTGISLILLFFAQENQWMLALFAFGFGLMGFNLSLSFYDSLLSLITIKSRQHVVSALGYSLGYLGGGLLFFINVLMVQNPYWFGLPGKVEAVKWSFLSVAIWWLIFSLPFYFTIKEPKSLSDQTNIPTYSIMNDFHRSLKKIIRDRNLVIFLIAYWLFIDAVYTVMNMATDYGTAIGLDSKDLIKALLLVQFLGFPCAFLSGIATRLVPAKSLLIFLLSLYFFAILWAMQMTTAWEFWTLATLIAIAQGGVQSLSRSVFAHLVPPELSGEYFGIFNLVGRFASIFGPFIIASLTYVTGSHRISLIGLLIPLGIGMLFLYKTKSQ
jgi:UMF1 family MFS transporter